MKVRTSKRFYDTKEKETRKVNDEFTVTKERFEELGNYVEEVKEVKKKKGE